MLINVYSKVSQSAVKKNMPPGGSRKGKPNKATKELKDMISAALDELGGVKYLKEQGKKNPQAFMSLLGKILPKDIKADITGDINITLAQAIEQARERLKQ
jgi:hypothetical protein